MSEHKLFVLTNPVPGREAEFNEWYTNVHIPEVIATPGFSGGQRFVLSSPTGETPAQKYLAIYDVTPGMDAVAAFQDLMTRNSQMTMSDAFDGATAVVQFVEAISPHQKA